MSKRGKRQSRAAKRRAALPDAAADVAPASAPPAAVGPSPERRHRSLTWPIAGVAAAAAVGIAVALALRGPANQAAQLASPTMDAGNPGGEVISQATPTPSSQPTPTTTLTAAPTPAPTPTATLAATPTPQPSAAPTVAPTASPAPATPAPTEVVVAAAGEPDESVATFYRNVADGDFDAAYALWSDRMRATYPREENLDGRFDETASITFQELFVAERSATTATVQANFTERYESGGGREFIGYWRLVLVNGRWLLEEPHY